MATTLMLVQGMTCPACERQIVDALVRTGARDVRADSGRGEVVLDPGSASEGQLREAVEALGYRGRSTLLHPEFSVASWRPLKSVQVRLTSWALPSPLPSSSEANHGPC